MSECKHCDKPIQWREYAYAGRWEHANDYARCATKSLHYATPKEDS